MPQLLRQSTAVTSRLGPFSDATDGVTPETGLSIAQADIQISKNHGAFAQTSDAAPTTTHDVDGWYPCPLTATDTNTLGPLKLQVGMTGAVPVWETFLVIPANVYDALVTGSDLLDVQVGGMDADVMTASALAADALAEIIDGILDEALSGHSSAGTVGKTFIDIETDAALINSLNDLTAAQVNAEVDTALTAYDAPTKAELDSGLAGLNDLTSAQVEAAADAALASIGLDHLISSADPGGLVANSSLMAKLVSKSATPVFSDFNNTTDSLQGLADSVLTSADLPSNFSSLSIDGNGRVDLAAWLGTAVTLSATSAKPEVDVFSISDSETAANNLELSTETMQAGTVDNSAHTPTTTQFEADDLTEATPDHYIGKTILFTSGALRYQATEIEDYALAGANAHFTVTLMTDAPANNDTFLIV
jgi:hypothetical protein